MYAIVGKTDYYGPKTQTRVVAFSTSRAALESHIARIERAMRFDYGCVMLAHNQASAESYEIRRCVAGRSYRGEIVPDFVLAGLIVEA